jgi:hypothetical protein
MSPRFRVRISERTSRGQREAIGLLAFRVAPQPSSLLTCVGHHHIPTLRCATVVSLQYRSSGPSSKATPGGAKSRTSERTKDAALLQVSAARPSPYLLSRAMLSSRLVSAGAGVRPRRRNWACLRRVACRRFFLRTLVRVWVGATACAGGRSALEGSAPDEVREGANEIRMRAVGTRGVPLRRACVYRRLNF